MTSPQDIYSDYKVKVDALITSSVSKDNPATLYEPIKYILSNGGKRIRPMMIIFACEICGGKMEEALNASDDLKNIMGLHDASLGAQSNEPSGRAILARQREGDVATFME